MGRLLLLQINLRRILECRGEDDVVAESMGLKKHSKGKPRGVSTVKGLVATGTNVDAMLRKERKSLDVDALSQRKSFRRKTLKEVEALNASFESPRQVYVYY